MNLFHMETQSTVMSNSGPQPLWHQGLVLLRDSGARGPEVELGRRRQCRGRLQTQMELRSPARSPPPAVRPGA